MGHFQTVARLDVNQPATCRTFALSLISPFPTAILSTPCPNLGPETGRRPRRSTKTGFATSQHVSGSFIAEFCPHQ